MFLLNLCVLSLLCLKLHGQEYFYWTFERGLNQGRTTDRIGERRKKPSTWQDLNPQPQEFTSQACALPLCYNRYPRIEHLNVAKFYQFKPELNYLKGPGWPASRCWPCWAPSRRRRGSFRFRTCSEPSCRRRLWWPSAERTTESAKGARSLGQCWKKVKPLKNQQSMKNYI